MQVKAALGHACLGPAAGEGDLPQQQLWGTTGGFGVLPRLPQGTAACTPLPWELALALTCPLCCSPGCSRFEGVHSHIAPIPARASQTKRQQTAMQTPSWRQPCSTAACSLREEKRGSLCPEQNHRAKLSSSVGTELSALGLGQ